MTPDALAVTLRPATDADLPFLLALRRETMTAHQLASGAEASERERLERVRYRFDCAQIIAVCHRASEVPVPSLCQLLCR